MKSLVCISLLLLFVSCKKEHAPDCVTATGPDVSSVRELGSFHTINLNDNMDVYLQKGTEFRVEAVAGKYIMDKISAAVQSGTLVLENKNTCNFVRGYKRRVKFYITVPEIKQVTNNAVGTIYFDENFSQDSAITVSAQSSGDIYVKGKFGDLYTTSHGNGDIYLSGSAKMLEVYTNGTNYVRAENLSILNYVYISTYSIGDVYLSLNPNVQFDYLIWDEGNIYFTGTPAVIRQLSDGTAKGKAIQK